ncbi:hypothetical protein [Aquibaculum sediminis]|uniref:hypothetical protein n=1 Tax=Aquibaculum sediminis TaxID=3231907 RepID=UPI003454BFE0
MVMEKLAHSAAGVKVHWLQEYHRRKLGQVRRVTVSCPQAAAHAEGFGFLELPVVCDWLEPNIARKWTAAQRYDMGTLNEQL